MAAIERI